MHLQMLRPCSEVHDVILALLCVTQLHIKPVCHAYAHLLSRPFAMTFSLPPPFKDQDALRSRYLYLWRDLFPLLRLLLLLLALASRTGSATRRQPRW